MAKGYENKNCRVASPRSVFSHCQAWLETYGNTVPFSGVPRMIVWLIELFFNAVKPWDLLVQSLKWQC